MEGEEGDVGGGTGQNHMNALWGKDRVADPSIFGRPRMRSARGNVPRRTHPARVRLLIVVGFFLTRTIAAEAKAQLPQPSDSPSGVTTLQEELRRRVERKIKRIEQEWENAPLTETPEQKLDRFRRELRRPRPILCEAFLAGQWVGVPCD